tara:strand:+ start:2273 stop:2773 length:501 start_codon:yes stop_codon:yes gene_type:complete
MKNKIIAVLTIFFFTALVIPGPALAVPPEETSRLTLRSTFEAISPLSKGQKAPFEGILFSKDFAAKIEAERKTMITLKLADVRTKAAIALTRSELQLKLDIMSGRNAALEDKHVKIVQINQEQIKFLRAQYMPTPWYEHPAFWVTIGIISGIGLTIGAAHIVKTVK